MNHQQDPYGNWLARFVFPEPVTELKIEVDLVADMTVYNPFDFFVEESGRELAVRISRGPRATTSSSTARRAGRPAARRRFLDTVPRDAHAHRRLRRRAQRAAVAREIGYVIRMEPGVQTPEETLRARHRARAATRWLLVQIAAPPRLRRAVRLRLSHPAEARPRRARRAAGHRPRLHRPARLVRGLPARRRLDRPRSDLGPADRREPHSAGRDAALPQRRADLGRGELRQGRLRLRHEGRRASPSIRASPSRSPTRPGRRSTRSASKVDAALAAGDVRLTMGGEPTFVSIDDFESARVEHRRGRPDQARARRPADPPPARPLRAGRLPALRAGQVVSGRDACRAGPSRSTGGATASRSGRTPSLIAEEGADDRAPAPSEAERLLQGIAGELGVEPEMRRRRPTRIRPSGSSRRATCRRTSRRRTRKLKDPEERHRIAARLRARADRAVGLCAAGPALAGAGATGRRWRSEKWKLRRGHLFLVPGDSPVGYRLPLGALPYVPPSHYPYVNVADPTEPRGPLPDFATARAGRRAAAAVRQPRAADGALHRRRRPQQDAGRAAARRRSAAPCAPR